MHLNKSVKKAVKNILIDSYKESYPSIDLEKIPEEEWDNKVYFRMHYLEPCMLDEIVDKHTKKLTKSKAEVVKHNVYLGAAPMSVPNTYTLRREEDRKTLKATTVGFISWKDNGRADGFSDKPSIGSSLILGYTNLAYTWLTTEIVDMDSDFEKAFTEEGFNFKTKNSNYNLTAKINKNEKAL